MEVQITPDQEAFIRQGIASGRYHTAEEAVQEALARWEQNERARVELLAAFDEAEADLEGGRFADYTGNEPGRLAAELKREARAIRDRGLR